MESGISVVPKFWIFTSIKSKPVKTLTKFRNYVNTWFGKTCLTTRIS